ncbi:MAG: alpha-L-fucosidase [Saprospiraceae bacterium]|nr:alpha-L-fucosidase [Saprospiraceae bacterium]
MKIHTGLLFLFLVAPCWLLGQASNTNIKNSQSALEWFKDAGLGLRIHWGLESQLGISMEHSLINASPAFQKRFFEDLPQSFNPRDFDAKEIAHLAKLAGVQYLVFTVKDKAGFCFWDTKSTSFNIINTPYTKDLLKAYVEAVRAAGLKVGIQFSTEDHHFLYTHDLPVKETAIEELDEEVVESYDGLIEAQCRELFSNYGKIDLLFLKGDRSDLAAKVALELQKDLLITGAALPNWEEHIPAQVKSQSWEVSFSMIDQWSFKARPKARSVQALLSLLIETRAKGGTALFNIGLRPDGGLPKQEEASLREMAAWSFVNAEAIEGVRPWIIHQEGEAWLARKKEATDVYLYLSPEDSWTLGEEHSLILKSVRATKDSKISLLGQATEVPGRSVPPVRYQQEGEQLQVHFTLLHQLYDNGQWPYPIIVKLTRAEPTLTPPIVQTLPPKSQAQNTQLKGFLAKKGDQQDLEYGFEYRRYAKLFSHTNTKWKRTEWVQKTTNGHFGLPLEGLTAGEYEVRALVKNPVLVVPGEILRFSIP